MKKNDVSNILYVGPYSRNPKGGVASVLREYEKFAIDFKVVNTYYNSKFILNIIPFIYSLFKILFVITFDRTIDIIHIHGASRGSFIRKFIVFRLCKILNKKIIYHIHGAEYHLFVKDANSFIRKRLIYMFKHVDVVICLSKQWKQYFNETFNISNIYVINNIVEKPDQKHFKSYDFKVCNFLFLGRIGKRKGVYDLMKSIIDNKIILKNKAKFFIGGDGEIDKLKSIIENNSLENIVEYIGWVSGERKKKYLINSNVLLLPSYNEGLPISLLEAMSFGLPVISTNVGGIPEIVKNNINGFLIEPGNIEQLNSTILHFVNKSVDYLKFSNDGLKIVEDFYPESVFDQLYSVYKEINITK